MREGYKETPIGNIPEVWKVDKLGNVVCLLKDGTHGTHENSTDGKLLLSAKDISGGKVLVQGSARKINQKEFNQIHTGFKLKNGDILLTIVGTIGRVALLKDYNEDFTFQRSVCYLRLNQDYNNSFYYYFFQSDFFQSDLTKRSNASAQAGVYLGELAKIFVPIPKLEEQSKIASILSTVDEKIDAIDERITRTKQLKSGLMQRLLTRGIGHTRYKDSPLGAIPESWEVVMLGNYAEIRGRIGWRGLKQSEYTEEGPFLIANKHIKNGKIDWNNCDHITEARYIESIEIGLQLGDVVFSKDGALGNPALITFLPNKGTINSTMMLVRPNPTLNPSFLFQIFISSYFEKLIKDRVSGSSIPHIFQRDMKGFHLPLPEVSEQIKIATILSTIDDKLDVLQTKKAKYEELKKGLMQKLLTGEVRVILEN